MVRVSYDHIGDKAYLNLTNERLELGRVTNLVEVQGVSLRLDFKGDKLVGIEICDASLCVYPDTVGASDLVTCGTCHREIFEVMKKNRWVWVHGNGKAEADKPEKHHAWVYVDPREISCFWVDPNGTDPKTRTWSRFGYNDTWTDKTLPPGAIFDATWWHDVDHWCGQDGLSIVAVVPPVLYDDHGAVDNRDNWWGIDQEIGDHMPWRRFGNPKDLSNFTVYPSIRMPHYHGWLRKGKFCGDYGDHVKGKR